MPTRNPRTQDGVFDGSLPRYGGAGLPRLRLECRENSSRYREVFGLQSVAVVARSHDAVRIAKRLRKEILCVS